MEAAKKLRKKQHNQHQVIDKNLLLQESQLFLQYFAMYTLYFFLSQ